MTKPGNPGTIRIKTVCTSCLVFPFPLCSHGAEWGVLENSEQRSALDTDQPCQLSTPAAAGVGQN